MSETEKERGAEMEEKAKEQEGSTGRGLHQESPRQALPIVWPSVRATLALARLSQGWTGLADGTDVKSCPRGEVLKRSGWQWGCPI